MKHTKKDQIKTLVYVLSGNAILAFAITAFVLPASLIAGGTTGLALLAQHFFAMQIPLTVLILNIAMFLLGFIVLGKKFAFTTILSTLVYPLFLDLFSTVTAFEHLCDDTLLSAIFAGILIGAGIGLVIKAGASTGGMDIPPLVLQKKFNIPVSISLYVFDTCILLAQMTFANTMQVLYGILTVLVTSIVINRVLLSGESQMQIMIISPHYETLRQAFLKELDSGVTLIQIETGLNKEKQQAVLSVLSHRKLADAKKIVNRIDDKAFMMISQTTEVHGRGYTIDRNV